MRTKHASSLRRYAFPPTTSSARPTGRREGNAAYVSSDIRVDDGVGNVALGSEALFPLTGLSITRHGK